MPRPSEYWNDIKSIAKEIKEEYPDPDGDHNERVEQVHADVDGSSWIIYYSNNEEVLRETENPPDSDHVDDVTVPDGTWKDRRATAAFLAMEGDVFMRLNELDEESKKRRSRKDWDPRK